MGVVYRGVDAEGRRAAIKVIRASFTSEAALRRFQRESSIRIEHPNVVRVLETGTDAGGMPFIAFELLEGETLAERLDRGPLEFDEVVAVGIGICGGLGAAHREGVVHRDLKPSNVFVETGGGVKILDFGVARLSDGQTRLTDAGLVVGTLDYLSPEQAEGRPDVDAMSDLFSLGAVLYETLVGRPPFRHDTPLGTLVATMLSDPTPPHFERPETPAALEQVILRALQKNPLARFSSATELADALSAGRGGDARAAHRPPTIPPGERRVVAILLAKGLRDEARLAAAIHQEGGRVLRLMGDRLIGLFGAETTSGDELIRAAAVALRCRAHAERISIGAGRATDAAAGISGSALEEAESALSVVIDGVAVSGEAARGLPKGLPLEALGDSLFALAPHTRVLMALDAVRGDGPLFGRQVELAQVERAVDDVLTVGRAAVVLISGPQGIGKSRVRGEAMRLAEDTAIPMRVLRARATAQRSRRALSLFQTLIREAAALLDDGSSLDASGTLALVQRFVDVPEAVERIASDLSLLVRDTGGQEGEFSMAATDLRRIDDRLRVSLLDWLEAVCRDGPLALVLEDFSFADPQSVSVLERLVERCFDAPLFVLACVRSSTLEARPDLFAGADVHRVELRGLSRADTGRLAAHAAKVPISRSLVARIHERTAGNPFFVEQIVHALVESGELDDPPDELPIPLTIEAALQSRLDHLPSSEKELLRHVSVFRRPFSVADVAALGITEPALLLRSLRRREVVVVRPPELFDFRSSLTGEVVYRTLTDERRASLHGLAAAWLEKQEDVDPEEVAHHHEAAGQPSLAARFFAKAAGRATRRGDADTVLRTSAAALRLGVSERLCFSLHMARADALRFRSRQEQAPELEAALTYAQDDRDRARALSEKSVALSRAGDSGEAARVGEEAVVAAEASGDERLTAIARGRLALALIQCGELERARELIAQVELATEDDVPEVRAMVLEWRAQVAGAAGDLGTRMRAFAGAAELHALVGDLRRAAGARANLADIQNRLGDYLHAAEALRTARDACREVGHRAMEGYVLLNLGYSLGMRGEIDASLTALDEARTLADATDEARLALLVSAYRARTLLAGKRHQEAYDEARRAADEANALGMDSVMVGARASAASAALQLGDVDAALAESARSYDKCVSLGGVEEDEVEVYLVRGRALSAAGRESEAATVLAEGRARLMILADGMRDEGLSRQLLERVPAHRELLALTEG
jgi:tetratricopeptide (TPR) repeat protein